MARALPERIPRRRVNAIVANGINCDVFDACCLLENRLPHELVHDIVREARFHPSPNLVVICGALASSKCGGEEP